MLRQGRHAVEAFLRTRGYVSPESRRIVAGQVMFTLLALGVGIMTVWISRWPLAFSAGSLLATANLYFLGKSIEMSMFTRAQATAKSSVGIALLSISLFWIRFVVTGFLLYIFIVTLSFPVIPLVAGLSTVVASLSLIGFSRIAGKL